MSEVKQQREQEGAIVPALNTSSITGRRAVDNLIQACGRMKRTEPDAYPVLLV